MQQYLPIDIARNKKIAKVSLWIGGALCSLALAVFLFFLIMSMTLWYNPNNSMGLIMPMAVTIFILAPVFLLGLTLIIYGVQKNKNKKMRA